jgi:hypothetical protein
MPRGPKGDRRRADVIGRPLPLRRRALPSERSVDRTRPTPEQSHLQPDIHDGVDDDAASGSMKITADLLIFRTNR